MFLYFWTFVEDVLFFFEENLFFKEENEHFDEKEVVIKENFVSNEIKVKLSNNSQQNTNRFYFNYNQDIL